MTDKNLATRSLPEEFDAQKVLDHVTGVLEEHIEDPEYKAGISMAVPGAPKTYGVRVPDLRAMAKTLVKQYKAQPEALIDLSLVLWEQESREHRLIALFALAGLKKKLAPAKRWQLGGRFLRDVADWELCDQMCHALLGPALTEDPDYMDELETWVTDENFWVRRAAIVSTVLLRRAKYPDQLAEALDRRALSMCARLLNDNEHYIRKAVDWTVREVIKRHGALAYEWMLEQTSDDLSSVGRSTLKLAAKKLSPDRQEEFLAAVEG